MDFRTLFYAIYRERMRNIYRERSFFSKMAELLLRREGLSLYRRKTMQSFFKKLGKSFILPWRADKRIPTGSKDLE